MHLINYIFYVGYTYLSLSILLFVISRGFFDGITYGFRRFASRLARNKDLLDDWQEHQLPSERISSPFLKLISFQGITLTIVMIVLLFIYYL
ncbi:DUF3899 domain-containing protein [Aquibacillus rhizosphaerae]|uniref:DUF3899 domain-containing protein n=1 Tax=Aquibacillus rhizosphaerae TaxID=3051431 RepID=A0ABT7LAN9_9BACI|nr:DUF3899 domain-containing protein [Aquibacillus sp. LR5S19]MDL4842921.1 DUF3899 domain-containing protein [Aquibacillus sp. LR5S19]